MLLDIYDALIADQRSVHSPEEIDSATSTGGCPSEDRCRQSSFSSRGTYSSSSFTSVKSYQRDISSLERCKTRGSGGSRPVPKKPEPRTPLRTSCVWSSSIQNDNRRCDTSIIQMPNTTDTNHNHQNEGPVFSRSPYRASHGSHRHYHQSEDQDARRDKRPLSISSTSSAMSSSSSSSASSSSSSLSSLTSSLPRCQGGQKKSYLASIESLEDDDQGDEGDDDDDDDEDEEEEDDCAKTNSSSGVSDVSSTNSGWGHRSETGRDKVLERNGGHCNATVTSPPPPTQCRVMRYCDPNLTYTDRVVIEIVDTERTYVRDLSEIIEGYLSHLKNGRHRVNIVENSVADLFGNIEEIYRFNRQFLQELEQCCLNPVSVARTFVKHNEGFAIYTQYCTNYPRTVSVLTDLMRHEEAAEVFKERQATLGHMLPLGSYLLKPVQRILKYHLFLQNMVKHYDKDKPGYEDVVTALATMTGIAHHINNMKRKHEHAVRVQEIQSLLYGWEGKDLTTYGELIAEGTFRVYGAKAVRHVFLFDKMLLVAKKKEDSSLSYKTHIMCSNLMLIESISGEPLCFHVIPFDNPRVQYTLQARNLEQKREWTLQLKRVILENYNVDIPSHARELVMQLGQNRPEDEILAERGTPSKKQHSAPEYLERRKQEKERRRMENFNKALRLRRGSKKRDGNSPLPPTSNIKSGCRDPRERSLSCDRDRDPSKDMDHKHQGGGSLNSHKGKKLRGWRRKSEPLELLSSQESLGNFQMSIVKTPCSSSTSSSGTTPSSSNRSYDRTGETSTDETPDSNKLTSSVRMMVMGSGNQDGTRGRPPSDHGSQDMSDEYVTFYFPQQLSTHSRRSDGMVSDTGTSDDAHIYDVPCVVRESPVTSTPGPGYDNLTNLWTCTNNHHRTSDHFAVTGLPANVQRVQSFNSSTCSSDCSYCLHPVRPDVLRLQGSPQLPEMLLDADGSPTTPAVWLKQQQDHLADGAIKAGSLPRSFQLNQESPSPSVDQDGTGECLAAFKLRRLADRPFTIASDKPSQSDLNLDDFERYIEDSPTKQPGYRFPVGRQDSEDLDSSATTDTAAESTEDITGTFVHPEHRIYRPSLSRSSLRSLIASVGSRLAGLKTHPHTPSGSASRDASETDHSCSCSSINTETDERDVLVSSQTSITGRTRFIERERTTSRLMVSVAHVYSRMLGHRARTQMKATPTEKGSRSTSPTAIANTFHRQGSPAIGARMAKPLNDYDYGTSGPKRSGNSCCGNRGSRPRPDSILSLTLEWGSSIRDLKDDENEIVISENTNEPTTNHLKETTVPQSQAPLVDSKVAEDISDGSEEGNATPPTPSNKLITGQEEANSDASADSYYERTFEAIEGFLENDLFRDSAVYSDSEEATDGSGAVISQDHDGKLPETLSESKTSSVSKDCVQTETPNNEWQPPTNDESPSIEISEDASSDIINRRLSNDEMKSQRPVKGQSILEKVRYLEQCSQYSHIKEVPISVENLKPIKERCRDLELWSLGSCREQEGDATDDTVGSQDSSLDRGPVEGAGSMGMLSPTDSTVSRGWVRQIVDRFQNDS